MLPRLPADELFHQVEALRPLARALVGEDAGADDLIQTAAARALESPPRSATSLTAWLARVMTHRARDQRRRDQRRQRREQAASPPEGTASTADLVERHELRMRIMRAVFDLDAVQREAVLLRYFEGLPPRRIAARLGVPVKTVDSRLFRARARLREELDEAFGDDRRAWVAAVAAIGAESGTSLPLTGVLLMKAIATTFALLVAAATWFLVGRGPQPSAAPPEPPSVATVAPDAPPRGPSVGESVRESSPAAEASPSTPTPVEGARGSEATWLEGTVVDVDGAPLAGVAVEARMQSPGDPTGRSVEELLTDADGRFRVSAETGSYELSCVDERYVTLLESRVDAGPPLAEPLIVVAPATRVAGIAVGPLDTPVDEVKITLELPDSVRARVGRDLRSTKARAFTTLTGTDGRFRIERAPAVAGITCEAVRVGYEPARVRLDQFPVPDLRLELNRPNDVATLDGLVLGPDGQPLAGAHVALGEQPVRADDAGRFRFEYSAGDPPARLMVVSRGLLPAVEERGDGPWPPSITVRLSEEALALAGVVLGPDGDPAPHARVWIEDTTVFGTWNRRFWIAENIMRGENTLQHETQADEHGRFRLAGLLRRDYPLFALDPALAWKVDAGVHAAGEENLVIRFPAQALIRRLSGRVVDHSGKPVAGAVVQAQISMLAAADPISQQRYLNVQNGSRGETGDDGRFLLEDVPRDVQLCVFGKGIDTDEEHPVPAGDGPITLVVSRICELRVENPPGSERATQFRVVDAAGQPVGLARRSVGMIEHLDLAPLVNGVSEVLTTTDRAAALVLVDAAGSEVGRLALHLDPETRNIVN